MSDLELDTTERPPTVQHGSPPVVADQLELLAALDADAPLPDRTRATNRLTVVLAVLLVLVGTFVAGAWYQREFGPSPASTAATAGGRGAGQFPTGASFPGAGGATGAGAGAAGGGGAGAAAGGGTGTGAGGFANATRGTVKLVDGNKVYVSTADGTIVIVTTTGQTPVQITKQGTAADLQPGQTVIVQGATQADGTVAATTIIEGAGGFGGFGGFGGGGGAGGGGGRGQGTGQATGQGTGQGTGQATGQTTGARTGAGG